MQAFVLPWGSNSHLYPDTCHAIEVINRHFIWASISNPVNGRNYAQMEIATQVGKPRLYVNSKIDKNLWFIINTISEYEIDGAIL